MDRSLESARRRDFGRTTQFRAPCELGSSTHPLYRLSPVQDATERGRDAYRRRAWRDAFDALSEASAAGPLDAVDLERLTWSAVLSGRDEPALDAFAKLHQARLDAGENLPAARAAFWLAL